MEISMHAPPRRTGRPLSFDRKAALRQAMLTFWRHGYETTSVSDLTAAMGISAPSLYTAFGDKRRLFLEAMRLYAGEPADMERSIADAPTAYQAAYDLMTAAATTYTGEATPKGCLLASATASGSAAAADVQDAVANVRRGIENCLRVRIERDIKDGVLPPGSQAASLAALVLAVTQGMSVLARDGASRTSLLAVVEAALHAWPGTKADDQAPVR
jgi:AcrR family transcriptional regulator